MWVTARALWTLPTNVVGHLAGLLVSGRWPRRAGGAAATGWLYPIRRGMGLDWVGAVTLGHAILYRPGLLDGVVQHSDRWGPCICPCMSWRRPPARRCPGSATVAADRT